MTSSSATSFALHRLSDAQVAIWFGQQQVPSGSTVYQCAERVDIQGEFDAALFTSVVCECLSEIPALNATYESTGGVPVGRPHPREHTLRLVDLSDRPDPLASCDDEIEALMDFGPNLGESGRIADEMVSGQVLLRIDDDHHVWLQRIHHICVDGYSFAMLLKWISQCYNALHSGDEAPPYPFAGPEPAMAASDDDRDLDRNFWHEYCSGRPQPGSFSDASPSVAIRRAHRETRHLRARTICDGYGWAESAMAATALYTAVMSGEAETTLGIPWANRPFGTRPAIEPTVNTLPLHIQVSPSTTVRELLGTVTKDLRMVKPHVAHRAERIRRDIGAVGIDAAIYGPVINVKFFTPRLALGPSTGVVTNITMGPVDDVTVTVSPQHDGSLVLEIETNPDRYTADTTRRHADRLRTLLGILTESDPDTPVGRIPVADARDVIDQIDRFNHTTYRDTEATLIDLLTNAVQLYPDRVSLRWRPRDLNDSGSLTHAELHAAAADLAKELTALGASPNAVVALLLTRSPETVVAIVATILAGAAYLPIDPELPEERISAILEDAQPVALVTTTANSVSDPAAFVWQWKTLSAALIARSQTRGTVAAPGPADAAYVIFTSGSTGRPKGTIIEHRSIVNRLRWMDTVFQLSPADRILQKTPYSFDVSVWEFFWPLITGASLVIADSGAERDSRRIVAELTDYAITVCHFVPSALAALLSDPAVAAVRSLRQVICSGEALPPETLRAAVKRFGKGVVANLYGPTEATVDITWWIPPLDPDGDSTVPIGLPVHNSAVWILDSALRPLPIGHVGELYLAGVQLARGYLRRPGLTATRFVADPFHHGRRMYATGDLARRRSDGNIEYMGRVDDQVKIRGRRIELGEITSVLLDAPGVAQAVTVTRGSGAHTILAGYVVAEAGAHADTSTIAEYLAHRLPAYMVPAAIVVIDEIPTTRNGKFDRHRLPAPTFGAREITGPSSPLEMTLSSTFADVLGREAVSVTDSFFELGGNSLTATDLTARLRTTLDLEVTVSDVFAAPSVSELARRITGGETTDPFGRLLPLRKSGSGTPLFCVHPAGGLGWCYAGLLTTLSSSGAVYALQADGLHGETLPSTLSEVAERYLDEVERITPRGPINLLGWSVGGVIAHEMAVRARSRGREVRRLVLMDAYPSESWAAQAPPTAAQVRRAFLIMAGIEDRPVDSDEDLRVALRQAHNGFGGLSVEQIRRIGVIVAHFAALMRTHSSSVFHGDAVMFRATVDTRDFLDPAAWHRYISGDFHQIDLPTTHPGMVHPESLSRIAAVLGDTDE